MSSISSSGADFQRDLMRLAESSHAADRLQQKLHEGLKHGRFDGNPQLLRTALQRASGRGRTANVRLILDAGAEVENHDYSAAGAAGAQELTALYRASELGHADIVRMLLAAGAKVGVQDDRFGRTAVYGAAMRGHVGTLGMLLDAGADVDGRDRDGRTVLLHLAAEKPGAWWEGERERVVRMVMARMSGDLDVVDRFSRTALMWAGTTGKAELVGYLLDGIGGKRARIEASNERGKTALHLAAENGREEAVRVLLEKGANVKAVSDGNWTALHNASEKGHLGVVRLLLEYKADVNAATNSGNTALHWAAQNGSEGVVKLLLAHSRINRTAKDADDTTPMLRAAQRKHKPIVQMFSPSDPGNWPTGLALEACKGHDGRGFHARVVDFGMEQRQNNVDKCSVFDLLYGTDPKDGKPLVTTVVRNVKSKPAFRWIHLPANNMAWVEALMTKHFIESGADDVDGFKELSQGFSRQHWGPKVHSRFMRPSCQRMHAAPKELPTRAEVAESNAVKTTRLVLGDGKVPTIRAEGEGAVVEKDSPKEEKSPAEVLSKAEKQQKKEEKSPVEPMSKAEKQQKKQEKQGKKEEKQGKKQENKSKKPEVNGVHSNSPRPTPTKSRPSNDGRKPKNDARRDPKPPSRHGNISLFVSLLGTESALQRHPSDIHRCHTSTSRVTTAEQR